MTISTNQRSILKHYFGVKNTTALYLYSYTQPYFLFFFNTTLTDSVSEEDAFLSMDVHCSCQQPAVVALWVVVVTVFWCFISLGLHVVSDCILWENCCLTNDNLERSCLLRRFSKELSKFLWYKLRSIISYNLFWQTIGSKKSISICD